MPIILTINAGSSSVKYQCFEMTDEVCLARGQIDRLGSPSPNLSYERRDNVIHQTSIPPMEHEAVFPSIFETLLDPERASSGISMTLSPLDIASSTEGVALPSPH